MKKAAKKSFSRTAGVVRFFFDVRKWSDFDRTRRSTLYLINSFKRLFVPNSPTETNSFDEAVQRYNLSADDLVLQRRALWRLSMLMCVIATGVFGYALYCLTYGAQRAFFLSIIVSMIALVLAFRYHFWSFQIDNRTLGCSLKQWFREGVLGHKP